MVRQRMFGFVAAMTFAGLMGSWGCFGPAGPETPDWNPDIAADACMKQYDTDRDGFLDKQEIAASPSLKGAARYLDTDGDKKLSRDEIFERIGTYQEIDVNVQALVEVYVKNRKLLDADIEFVPEDFLADFIEPAHGSSHPELGVAQMTSEGAPFDSVHVGFYRVKITSQSVQVRKEYNEETTLGCEVSPVMGGTHRFDVKIK